MKTYPTGYKSARRKTGAGAINTRPSEEGEAKSGDLNDQRRHFAMHHLLGQLPDCCTVQQETDTSATIYCSRHQRTITVTAK